MNAVTLDVKPLKAPVDAVARINVRGLAPQARIKLRLAGPDQKGKEFASWADFRAGGDGTVDVGRQAPLAGAYSGVDPMGLFWSMEPVEGKAAAFEARELDPLVFTLSAQIAGKTVAGVRVERFFWDKEWGILREAVEGEGLQGTLFYPGKGVHPGLLLLGGSDGGRHEANAALLAGHGFAVLDLPYFKLPGLPPELIEVPLEICRDGIEKLASHPAVAPGGVGVAGTSKGGELALLAAANFPEKVRALAAVVPSCVVWQALSERGRPPDKSSWTLGGRGLPYVHMKLKLGLFLPALFGRAVSLLPIYHEGLANAEEFARARIPVEKIPGPILLITGRDDRLWPSPGMCDRIVAELRERKFPYPCEHVSYPGAGHGFRPPYLPSNKETARGPILFGGKPADNARACREYWAKLIHFFSSSVGPAR